VASPSLLHDLVCEMARASMVAHQRRGESDLVAHWLWQVCTPYLCNQAFVLLMSVTCLANVSHGSKHKCVLSLSCCAVAGTGPQRT
jgi:hypothetical protein